MVWVITLDGLSLYPFRNRQSLGMAAGLQYLHSQNILHGALQPSNVLIGAEGEAVLSDFALAKHLASDSLNSRSNTFTGTLRYQAPEISDNKPMSAASDVYSWAMTALEVISGRKSPRIADVDQRY